MKDSDSPAAAPAFSRALRWGLRAAVVAVLAALAWSATPDFDPARYLEHVKYLASPELKGRGTGMPELDQAANYIVRQFRDAGLQPPGAAKGFEQAFRVTTNARLGKNNRLEIRHRGKTRKLQADLDFRPFNFSASAEVSAPVVFAGYGITAAEYNYDDYAGLDVRGKLVIVLRHEPQENDEKSVFAGRSYTEHAQFFSKAANAKAHGAAGVILLNNGQHAGTPDSLEKFARSVGPNNAGIPFVQVKAEIVSAWISEAGKDLKAIQEEIDKDLQPRSFALPEDFTIRLAADVQRDSRVVNNVAGYLPGETDEYVVIGAHYDHLGLGEQFSMSPAEAGAPHLGADDNASGTAGVIELARHFAAGPKQRRGILFLCFAGEELGLLGSSYFVNNSPLPIEKAVAMINLDMIGRIRDGKVYVGGAATGSTLRKLVEEEAALHSLKADLSDHTGYGSSDHTSFTTRQVPVLFFFSGLHADYHRPSDTWDKISAPETARLLALLAGVTRRLANDTARPEFVRVEAPKARAGMGGGYGAYFGSVPDFAEIPGGMRFSDVRPGSPADEAGLKGGDILFEFDGKPIQSLYDFTYALRARKPGDRVTVKVRRGGEVVEAVVTLGERK